ncbi:hypothetical protein BDB01DRAFT_255528 [Pilobolus umbonatus]|nr:hypothetical protein BDB01DRAFT_255528 [Pilobolus umbonatus]
MVALEIGTGESIKNGISMSTSFHNMFEGIIFYFYYQRCSRLKMAQLAIYNSRSSERNNMDKGITAFKNGYTKLIRYFHPHNINRVFSRMITLQNFIRYNANICSIIILTKLFYYHSNLKNGRDLLSF